MDFPLSKTVPNFKINPQLDILGISKRKSSLEKILLKLISVKFSTK